MAAVPSRRLAFARYAAALLPAFLEQQAAAISSNHANAHLVSRREAQINLAIDRVPSRAMSTIAPTLPVPDRAARASRDPLGVSASPCPDRGFPAST